MKKIKNYTLVIMALLLAFCGVLSSCSADIKNPSGADYSLIKRVGQSYILFDDISVYNNVQKSEVSSLSFTSLKELKDTVINGKLEAWQKGIIADSFSKDKTGEIVSCDFNNMFEPVLPEEGRVNAVDWSGASYGFSIGFDDKIHGWVVCCTAEEYDYFYTHEYEELFDRETITVTGTETLDDGKTVINYFTSRATLRNVRYEMSDNDKTVIVDKDYRVNQEYEEDGSVKEVAELYRITMYCKQGEKKYWIELSGFEQEPTDEWLMSFGLTPYREK